MMYTDYLERYLAEPVTLAWSSPHGGINMVQGVLDGYDEITHPDSAGRETWLETTLTIDGQEFDMIGPYEVMRNHWTKPGQEQK